MGSDEASDLVPYNTEVRIKRGAQGLIGPSPNPAVMPRPRLLQCLELPGFDPIGLGI